MRRARPCCTRWVLRVCLGVCVCGREGALRLVALELGQTVLHQVGVESLESGEVQLVNASRHAASVSRILQRRVTTPVPPLTPLSVPRAERTVSSTSSSLVRCVWRVSGRILWYTPHGVRVALLHALTHLPLKEVGCNCPSLHSTRCQEPAPHHLTAPMLSPCHSPVASQVEVVLDLPDSSDPDVLAAALATLTGARVPPHQAAALARHVADTGGGAEGPAGGGGDGGGGVEGSGAAAASRRSSFAFQPRGSQAGVVAGEVAGSVSRWEGCERVPPE